MHTETPPKRVWRSLLSLLLIVSLTMAACTGCYDRIELEGMAFVVSLGIDKAPDDMIDVTARIAVPSAQDGGGGREGGGESGSQVSGAEAITVRAHTIPGALNFLNTTVERRISLLHLSNLVIGEEMAQDEQFIEYLRPLTRYREFRRTVHVFVTRGSARKTFDQNKPVLEKSVSRFTESVTNVGKHTGLTPYVIFHEFITSMEAPNQDAILPTVGINDKVKKKTSSDDSEGESWTEETELSSEPGEVVRQGGNPLEFVGTGVFRDAKLVTMLDGIETRMLLTLRGELLRTQMDFPDPLQKGAYVTVELKHARSPHIEVDLSQKPVRVHVNESLEGDLIGVQSKVNYTELKHLHRLEQKIAERLSRTQRELIERMFHEYQADPFHIFKQTRSQFATAADLQRFPFRKALKTAKVDVLVTINIRRTGVQTAPIVAK